MNLIGLMIARNEDWVIEASIRAALEWVDEMVVLLHRCTDQTGMLVYSLADESTRRVHVLEANDDDWPEMDHRQVTLTAARQLGATHCAIIDADEIVTQRLRFHVRRWFHGLGPGQAINLPMVPVWRDLDHYRQDASIWSRSLITLGFGDREDLAWSARDDGYQHHARMPRNIGGVSVPVIDKPVDGGVMHLQWASWPRLLTKQALYQMNDLLRWPDREPPSAIRQRYSQAVNEDDMSLRPVPIDWWGRERPYVRPNATPWQAAAIRGLVDAHGLGAFEGLDLFGVEGQP